MILLGAFIEYSQLISENSIIESLKKVLSEDKHHLIEINKHALWKGAGLVAAF